MNDLIVRKAEENELSIVQELNHQLFVHDEKFDSLLKMNWPLEKEGADYFKDKISGKDGVCFVAEMKGEIVGYLAGLMIEPHSYRTVKKMSELDNMLVKENLRGQGIGEKLFEKFVEWSKEQEAERIKVSASTDNSGAIEFYKRVGFVPYAAELECEVK